MWGIARISVILSVGAVEESKYCFFLGLDSIMTVFESPRFSFFSSSSSFNPDKQSVFCYLKELLKPCSIYSDADRMCAMSCLALVNSRGSNHMTTVVAVVQSLSCVWLFATPWTAARQASVSFTISTPGFCVFHYLHARLPCLSLSPGVCSYSCPLSQWCHPAISPSLAAFFSCPQSFPASGSFPMNWLFKSGSQRIGASASASILPMNIQDWLTTFRIDLFDLAVLGTLNSLLQHHTLKASTLQHSAFFMVQLAHPYMTTGKTITWTVQTTVGKMLSLLFNTLSRFVIAFLLRSKHLLISWLQSPSTVILVVV